MQYGFYINQKALVEISQETGIKLDLKDGAIIEYVAQFSRTNKMNFKVIENEIYYYVDYKTMLDELPLLDIENERVLGRRLLNLDKAGIFKKYYTGGDQKKVFIGFGQNYTKIIMHLGDNSHRHSKVSLDENIKQTDLATDTQKYHDQYPPPMKINEADPNFGNWEPSQFYKETIQKSCEFMQTQDFELELTKFKLHFASNPPINPDKSWLGWCQRANTDYQELRLKAQRIQKADQLSNQRIQEFHEKKQENIQKVGTAPISPHPNSTYQNRSKKEVFEPYWRDYETREAYEKAILDAKNKGLEVKINPLPSNTQSHWNSAINTNSNISKLLNKFTPEYPPEIDVEKLKNQILNQYA